MNGRFAAFAWFAAFADLAAGASGGLAVGDGLSVAVALVVGAFGGLCLTLAGAADFAGGGPSFGAVAPTAQQFARATECRSDGILRNAEVAADFAVGLALQVIAADDFGVAVGQAGEEFFHLVPVFDAAFEGLVRGRLNPVPMDVSHGLGHSPLRHFVDDNAARDDGEVGGEGTASAKAAEDRVVFLDQADKDFGAEVILKFRRNGNTARMRGVVNNVHEQTEKAIDKIAPSSRLVCHATGNQIAVSFCQGHGVPLSAYGQMRVGRLPSTLG